MTLLHKSHFSLLEKLFGFSITIDLTLSCDLYLLWMSSFSTTTPSSLFAHSENVFSLHLNAPVFFAKYPSYELCSQLIHLAVILSFINPTSIVLLPVIG